MSMTALVELMSRITGHLDNTNIFSCLLAQA